MVFLYILCVVFIISPFFPLSKNPHWFFRTPDYIRLQSIAFEVFLMILLFVFHTEFNSFQWILVIGLLAVSIYQFEKVYRYSSLFRRKKYSLSTEKISLLAANVFQDNNQYQKFLEIVTKYNPDLVLGMETNKAWENEFSLIEEQYPYSVKIPLENYYGMHLYSKKALCNISIKHQVEEDVPSIFCEIEIRKGENILLICLHPAPPSPTENDTSIERDAELMLTGKFIRNQKLPVVVCGDMNDVVWSRPTILFKKMTGMKDPRIGRGFFPTYHAKYWFMRFPLDHLFHTKDLLMGKMERTSYFGSDHFGMYYEIHKKKTSETSKNPDLNLDEKEEINELIERSE
jgi:endonuclease/exonuclease/phosphatase (EEP) superfamily protein YafD